MEDLNEKFAAGEAENEMPAESLPDEVLDEVAGGCCPRMPIDPRDFASVPRKSAAEHPSRNQ